jgi:hypothetical protein
MSCGAVAGDEETKHRAAAIAAQPWLVKNAGDAATSASSEPTHPFAAFVGDAYTIDPKRMNGMFKFSDGASSVITGDVATMARRLRLCYAYCFATLFILAISSWRNEPNYPNQGLAVLLTVLVLDSCMFLLWRGGLDWSPAYACAVMGLSRVAIAAFVGT